MTTYSSISNPPISIDVGQPSHTESAKMLSRFGTVYYQGFLIALLITWSPFNLLAYGAPFLMLGWFFLRTRSKAVAVNLAGLVLLWLLSTLLHWPFIRDFAWASSLLSIFTYSAFIPVLVIPTRFLSENQLFPRMQRWIARVVIVESLWGIAQALYAVRQTGTFDGANGDYVEGTIHPALVSEFSFSNPMFAANMTILLLVLLPAFLTRRKYFWAICLGLASLVLASVVHVLIFLGVAIGIVGVLYGSIFLRRVSSWLLVFIVLLGVLLAGTLLQNNFRFVGGNITTTVEAKTPRGVVLERVMTTLPEEYPFMPLIGFGLGQFSSRASLITTGEYFGGVDNPRAIPFVPIQISRPMADYFWDQYQYARTIPWFGSTQQPAFSWLSVYAEMGGIFCFLVASFVFIILIKIRLRARTYGEQVYAMALSVGILFMCLVGLQENYWEIPQAIFPGLLLLKAMYAHLYTLRSAHPVNL